MRASAGVNDHFTHQTDSTSPPRPILRIYRLLTNAAIGREESGEIAKLKSITLLVPRRVFLTLRRRIAHA